MREISPNSPVSATSLLISLERKLVPLVDSGVIEPRIKQYALAAPGELFPHSRSPEGAFAGMLLIAGFLDDSHKFSQELATAEGSYWHALAHRMEPDTANSNYWFSRTGPHATFPDLLKSASEILGSYPGVTAKLRNRWEPILFNQWCDRAREAKDPEFAAAVTEIHTAECWSLWRWCAAPTET